MIRLIQPVNLTCFWIVSKGTNIKYRKDEGKSKSILFSEEIWDSHLVDKCDLGVRMCRWGKNYFLLENLRTREEDISENLIGRIPLFCIDFIVGWNKIDSSIYSHLLLLALFYFFSSSLSFVFRSQPPNLKVDQKKNKKT